MAFQKHYLLIELFKIIHQISTTKMSKTVSFGEAGKLWKQAAKPYSDHWNNVMNELISLDFTIVPTFNIYEASRDLHRARRAEWHEDYTLPFIMAILSTK